MPQEPNLFGLRAGMRICLYPGRALALFFATLLGVAGVLTVTAQERPSDANTPGLFLTNVIQFKDLSRNDYLKGCAFRFTGIVTLIDSNRQMAVLQDESGSVGLHCRTLDPRLRAGLRVLVEGTNCYQYVVSFPPFPFSPSHRDILSSLESPGEQGEYYLNRLRGYLHPPATGEYTFWIASDNSSELWLSTDEDPSKSRKIASISRYSWVTPREWARYPSQRSESIYLKAGQPYYVEVLHEQATFGENLAVAWQGPALEQSVIEGRFLTPWIIGDESAPQVQTGILREHWTDYASGSLSVLTGAKAYDAMVSVENVRYQILGEGEFPEPERLVLNEPMVPEQTFRWVEMEGRVRFKGSDRNVSFFELTDGHGEVEVRVLAGNSELPKTVDGVVVRVRGVLEGVYTREGNLLAGLIWATKENCIFLAQPGATNRILPVELERPSRAARPSTNSAMEGFYSTRGVVTFNDVVLGQPYSFVQEDTAAMIVRLSERKFRNQLKVGNWVELGGTLRPGRFLPSISPLVVMELGWRSMPAPITAFPTSASEGRWAEIQGIPRSVGSNGTIIVSSDAGVVHLWISGTASNELGRYVDAKLRVRGVVTFTMPEAPLVLVPSSSFVDVIEPAPDDPFRIPLQRIADVTPAGLESFSGHRIRLSGQVTYREGRSFFLQDSTGGIRVEDVGNSTAKVGDSVEVVGFPSVIDPVRVLSEVVLRRSGTAHAIKPMRLDPTENVSLRQGGSLVEVTASVIAQKTHGDSTVLELQEQQRVFQATLAKGSGQLPAIVPGSVVRVTGVCDNQAVVSPLAGKISIEKALSGALNVRLRNPQDVVVLKGPPWWTWKQTAILVGALLAVLSVALLWVQILRIRLERQRSRQLAFSRQILESLESERRRIAVNLHDSLGQSLLAIRNQALLAMQRAPDEPALKQRLNEISGASSQAIEEVREITHGLRPYQLDRLGLTQAIRAAVDHAAETTAISFATRVDDIDSVFDKDSEIHLYRIVQEAINNIMKHSGATEAAVVIKRNAAGVSLSVRDNGRGFDMDALRSVQSLQLGYGLSGIAERVRILGGTFAVESRPGGGTSLSIEISAPVRNNEPASKHTHH